MVMKWEYWVRQMPYDSDSKSGRDDITDELNDLGQDGWELVDISYRHLSVVTCLIRVVRATDDATRKVS